MLVLNLVAVIGSIVAGVQCIPWRFAETDEASEGNLRMALQYPAHYIDMPIDHYPDSSRYEPHDKGTFKNRYFFDATHYKPGGPVIVFIGGETSATSRFEDLQNGIVQILEAATNGLGVILETRYYGTSYPFESSTTDQLRFLSTEQVIADVDYFARHSIFPGVSGNETLNSPKTPWIVYGGSWGGALTAWSLHEYGGSNGSLWGGIAASGTTHAVLGYPQWYAPIQKYAPQDCVASINAIVDKIDYVFGTKNATLIHQMKAIFGLETLVDTDFAQTIAWPIGGPLDYPLGTWQELNWNPAYAADNFWQFCNNVTNLDAPESITAVDNELAPYTHGESWTNLGNYANYIKSAYLPLCEGVPINSIFCAGTQNETFWAETANSGFRSYLYYTCTEFGFYQVAPARGPSLISRALQASYTQQWCNWAFPAGKHNSIPSTPDLSRVNKYGGYSVVADRLAHVDGDQDVWGDACFHSTNVPQRYSTTPQDAALHPQLLITGSGHHWDSYGLAGLAGVADEPQFIRAAHQFEIRAVQRWVEEWKASV